MTLNGVMALILRYFTEFGSFRGALRKSDWRYTQTFSDKNVAQSTYFLAIYHFRWYDVGNRSIGGIKRKKGSEI